MTWKAINTLQWDALTLAEKFHSEIIVPHKAYTQAHCSDSFNTTYRELRYIKEGAGDPTTEGGESLIINERQLPYQHIICRNLDSVNPMFVLTTEKVTKQIRKNSRGKSGRYVSYWAYLPKHKRNAWVCRQVLNETQFLSAPRAEQRLRGSFYDLLDSMESHYLNQRLLATYGLIFKNYKQSLMNSFRRQRRVVKPIEIEEKDIRDVV